MARALFFAALAMIAAWGLWLTFKPPQEGQAPAAARGEQPAAAGLPAPQREVFELIVKDGHLISGPAVIRVREGAQVVVRVTADHTDELHLHGYDLHAALKPGEPASLELAAVRTGRFSLELHHADVELGALEVYPR